MGSGARWNRRQHVKQAATTINGLHEIASNTLPAHECMKLGGIGCLLNSPSQDATEFIWLDAAVSRSDNVYWGMASSRQMS
jgi:hypothetical protein